MSMENNYWVKNEKRARKGFDQHIAVFTNAMKAYPSPIGEEEFVRCARERFIELLPALPRHAGSEKHIFNGLMPALATVEMAEACWHSLPIRMMRRRAAKDSLVYEIRRA
jgi:hypothetical protein